MQVKSSTPAPPIPVKKTQFVGVFYQLPINTFLDKRWISVTFPMVFCNSVSQQAKHVRWKLNPLKSNWAHILSIYCQSLQNIFKHLQKLFTVESVKFYHQCQLLRTRQTISFPRKYMFGKIWFLKWFAVNVNFDFEDILIWLWVRSMLNLQKWLHGCTMCGLCPFAKPPLPPWQICKISSPPP